MEQFYYGIATVVYGIFIVRFILSWIGGDFDLDADSDLDLGDVVSFKGLTHFLMGLSGWLSTKSLITHNVEWYDYLIGSIIGLIFVIILFSLYKFMFKLEQKPIILSGRNLIGKTAKVYLVIATNSKNAKYIITVFNGVGTIEFAAKSNSRYNVGDSVIIKDYQDSYYII